MRLGAWEALYASYSSTWNSPAYIWWTKKLKSAAKTHHISTTAQVTT